MSELHFNQHISQRFNEVLDDVKNRMLLMGGLVEKQVANAIQALEAADSELAEQVMAVEEKIDDLEREIDEECTLIIARRQPTASDLRLVMAVIKVLTDLERIGDEANKIARFAIQLCDEGQSPRGYTEIRHIGDHVRIMVRDALDAFARFDAEQALNVMHEDKVVDREYATAIREMITYMMEDPRSISRVINIIWSLRALERIGDHARNVAEYVIYLVKGQDVRHISTAEVEKRLQGE